MRFIIRMLISKIHVSQLQFRLSYSATEKCAFRDVVSDLKTAENIFRKHQPNESVNKFLHQCFDRNDKLHSCGFLIQACERYENHRELTHTILLTFSEWFQKNKQCFSLTLEKKLEILDAALKQKTYILSKYIFKALHDSSESEYFQNFAEALVKQNKFIEAAILIRLLNIQEKFSLEEILYPLMFDNQMNFIVLFLKDHPKLQLEFVKKLDGLLKNCSSSEYSHHLNHRRVYKVLSSIINIFNISAVECKNLHFIRSKGAINMLVKKKSSTSRESWEELILNVVGDNAELRRCLLIALTKANDRDIALEMAKKFCIPENQLPDAVLENGTDASKNESIEDDVFLDDTVSEETDIKSDLELNTENDYLKFKLEFSNIKFVTNVDEFSECISEITQNYDIIGIDSEWKPRFGLSQDRLSLVQIAGHDKVFILDMLSLKKCLEEDHWDKLMDDVFGNPKIIKLGFGIMTDVQMLVDNQIRKKGKSIKFAYILDLAIFYEKLKSVYPHEFDFEEENASKGLSQLCLTFLGKSLNKEERICDWEKRPLSESQLEYAALDAYCLLEIYDKLKEIASEKNINFEHLKTVSIILTTSLWKSKKMHKNVKQDPELNIAFPISIDDFKVAVESKFMNLAKKLREYGADVIELKNRNATMIAELAKSERRIVLCSPFLARQLKHRVSKGLVFVLNEDSNDVLIPHVFQKFNVQVYTRSMFTRCIACNSLHIRNISHTDLAALYKQSQNEQLHHAQDKEDKNENNFIETNDELALTVSNMLRSGISINFNDFNLEQLNEVKHCSLCTSCGNIHCHW